MTSIIKVDQIQDTAGTVLMDNEPVVDIWRLTADFGTNGAAITGWARPDDGYTSSINGLTESSGVFTFTKTGLYAVTCHFRAQNVSASDSTFSVVIQVSTDSGSNYDSAALNSCGETTTGTNNGASCTAHINVTDISTFRVQFLTSSVTSGTVISGGTDINYTSVSFIKLAPAQ